MRGGGGGGRRGVRVLVLLTFGGGGGGVVQNRESPDFRSPEVGRYALAKDTFFRLRPDLPTHFKSLVTLSSVKCAFFVLFDYAVSISFRTIN